MAEERMDWELFWERYGLQAPKTREALDLVTNLFEEVWRRISPVVGVEHKITISLTKEGKLSTEMAGWVLIGAIARAASIVATKTSEETMQEAVAKLETRLTTVEEWCGIKKPPSAE
jgi:hypothetical protein